MFSYWWVYPAPFKLLLLFILTNECKREWCLIVGLCVSDFRCFSAVNGYPLIQAPPKCPHLDADSSCENCNQYLATEVKWQLQPYRTSWMTVKNFNKFFINSYKYTSCCCWWSGWILVVISLYSYDCTTVSKILCSCFCYIVTYLFKAINFWKLSYSGNSSVM